MSEKRDLNDSKIFSDELIKTLETKKKDKTIGDILKRLCDGEPKNVNPLTEISESQMRLYGFSGAFNSIYFDTEEELIEWGKSHNTEFGDICVIDYLGNVAACDEDGYGIYNFERSTYRGEFVWEYNHGSIREMYSAFRDRGISFENDIYGKIDERNNQLMVMLEKHQRRVLTKKKTYDNGDK